MFRYASAELDLTSCVRVLLYEFREGVYNYTRIRIGRLSDRLQEISAFDGSDSDRFGLVRQRSIPRDGDVHYETLAQHKPYMSHYSNEAEPHPYT